VHEHAELRVAEPLAGGETLRWNLLPGGTVPTADMRATANIRRRIIGHLADVSAFERILDSQLTSVDDRFPPTAFRSRLVLADG
jgi:hypothetical protein